MTDMRGLAPETVFDHRDEARRFLDWLGERVTRETLAILTVSDVDAYVKTRTGSLRRASIKGVFSTAPDSVSQRRFEPASHLVLPRSKTQNLLEASRQMTLIDKAAVRGGF
jgi:hypothetical protein